MAARSALERRDWSRCFRTGAYSGSSTPSKRSVVACIEAHDRNVQYAVARGARLASGRGGHFWYASDETATLEYLATFRRDPREGGEMTS